MTGINKKNANRDEKEPIYDRVTSANLPVTYISTS